MGWASLIGPGISLISSLFGGHGNSQSQQSQAAGNMYTNAANAYGSIGADVKPFLTSQMLQGLYPQTYNAAMGRTQAAGQQTLNSMTHQMGPGLPNKAGQTG